MSYAVNVICLFIFSFKTHVGGSETASAGYTPPSCYHGRCTERTQNLLRIIVCAFQDISIRVDCGSLQQSAVTNSASKLAYRPFWKVNPPIICFVNELTHTTKPTLDTAVISKLHSLEWFIEAWFSVGEIWVRESERESPHSLVWLADWCRFGLILSVDIELSSLFGHSVDFLALSCCEWRQLELKSSKNLARKDKMGSKANEENVWHLSKMIELVGTI